MSLFGKNKSKQHRTTIPVLMEDVEFVKEGMHYTHVIKILRTSGILISEKDGVKKCYWNTDQNSVLTLTFKDNEVIDKTIN